MIEAKQRDAFFAIADPTRRKIIETVPEKKAA